MKSNVWDNLIKSLTLYLYITLVYNVLSAISKYGRSRQQFARQFQVLRLLSGDAKPFGEHSAELKSLIIAK